MTLLPLYESILNGISLFLMILGVISVKQKKIIFHKSFMVGALVCSIGFLCLYLVYHFNFEEKKYLGENIKLYYFILITHIPLAAVVPFLVGISLYKALTNQISSHKKIAKITVPIWSYVSVTGIIIYLMVHGGA